jgi:hypothetical protein
VLFTGAACRTDAPAPTGVLDQTFGHVASAAAPEVGVVTDGGPKATLCSKLTACMTVGTERAFNCQPGSQCENDWESDGRFALASDTTAPLSPPNVGQITFPAGFQGGSAAGRSWPGGLRSRTLHVAAWLRFSPNFQSHATGINKVFHFFIDDVNRLFFQANGGGLAPAIGLQQLAAPFNNGAGHVGTAVLLSPNLDPGARMTRGQWHRVDLLLRGNTPGVANGAVMAFLNGRKVLDHEGIMFAAEGGDGRWRGFNWSPTWGGTGDLVAEEMYIQLDHIVISGKD